jgi:hypothetical protein
MELMADQNFYKVALALHVNKSRQNGFHELIDHLQTSNIQQNLHIGLITIIVYGKEDAKNLKQYLIQILSSTLREIIPISFFPHSVAARHPQNVGGGKTLVIYPRDETPWKCLNNILTSALTLYNLKNGKSYFPDPFTAPENYKPHMTLCQMSSINKETYSTLYKFVERYLVNIQNYPLSVFQWNYVTQWKYQNVSLYGG